MKTVISMLAFHIAKVFKWVMGDGRKTCTTRRFVFLWKYIVCLKTWYFHFSSSPEASQRLMVSKYATKWFLLCIPYPFPTSSYHYL